MGVQTFWLERTDQVAVGLRRYSHAGGGDLTCAGGYHSALVYTGFEPADYGPEGYLEVRPMVETDPRWPTTCERCDYEFAEDDHWQMWQEQVYRRTDTGGLRVLHSGAPAPEAPAAEPGASWDAWWLPEPYRGPDGIALMVRCPDGHDWLVDSRASNCTLPDDDVHQCWVRHGDPRECRITVDKSGVTCSAGAGSIQTPNWHGFLHAGQLV